MAAVVSSSSFAVACGGVGPPWWFSCGSSLGVGIPYFGSSIFSCVAFLVGSLSGNMCGSLGWLGSFFLGVSFEEEVLDTCL